MISALEECNTDTFCMAIHNGGSNRDPPFYKCLELKQYSGGKQPSIYTKGRYPIKHSYKYIFSKLYIEALCFTSAMLHFALVDGEWEEWGEWQSCKSECGGYGTQKRIRSCRPPPSNYNGASCLGNTYETS